MNIKNRLQKLEQETPKESGVCSCRRSKHETWKQEVFANGTETEPELFSEAVPDTCEVCLKPIEKETLILAFTESTIPIPEGARHRYEHTKSN